MRIVATFVGLVLLLSISFELVPIASGSKALAAPRPRYVEQELGSFGGNSFAADISENGVVVGGIFLPNGESHAFVWTQSGGIEDIGTLGGTSGIAFHVSDNGKWIAGASETADGVSHSFVWTRETGMINIDQDGSSSIARAINNEGTIIGTAFLPDSAITHGFLWMPGTSMILLSPMTHAFDVNNSGLITGSAGESDQFFRAVAWTLREGLIELDPSGLWDRSEARAVNDDGFIVGGGIRCKDPELQTDCTGGALRWSRVRTHMQTDTLILDPSLYFAWAEAVNTKGIAIGRLSHRDGSPSTSFAWGRGNQWVDIGHLGGLETESLDSNTHGTVVGTSRIEGEPSPGHAFVWTRSEGIVDLSPATDISDAQAINDLGQIVGNVCSRGTSLVCRATLWTLSRT